MYAASPAPPPPTTSTSTAVSVESVTSNVESVTLNVWMVYSPDVVTVPPVAREEEHEPLGDAGDDAAALGSLNTRTCPYEA